MSKYIFLILLAVITGNSYSQLIVRDTSRPSMEWSFSLVDLPFMKNAAQSEANHRKNGFAGNPSRIQFGDYGKFYRNMSMEQVTGMSRNLHGTGYYVNNLLWHKWIKPTTTKRYILNRLLANLTATATDFAFTKLPYGYAYQHEEFHRSVMNVRGIYSYDEVWKFGKGFDIAVTRVKDEDLIYLKSKHPADMIRLSASGVEGEYAYFQRMREDNFFKNTGYPFVGLTILGTMHAINYVNLPFTERFNRITDSILAHDKHDILARDFTGYDFSAWVYDLHRPHESYEARGNWPDGIGIKRPIKETQLTYEMKKFLKQTGNMQYINLVTPFITGINKLHLGENFNFNFALRSVPSSFGYYAGGDFFIETKRHKVLASLGYNKSSRLTLPSIDIKYFDVAFKYLPVKHTFQLGLWLQPKDQLFFATKSQAGCFLKWQPTMEVSDKIRVFTNLEYKTKGWVFGNPYLDDNFSVRAGIKIRP